MKKVNRQTHNFLVLLCRAANRGREQSLLTPVDWSAVLKLAEEQNLLALIFEMVCEFPEFLSSPAYGAYIAQAMVKAADQTQRTAVFLRLYRAFLAQGLHPIVIKGIICRQLYGEYGDYRPSGDEDILIRAEEFDSVKNVLEAQGFSAERAHITRAQLKELQEITFYHARYGLQIEVHLNLIGHENELRRRMNDCFSNVFEGCQDLEIAGVRIRTMSHTKHFLYLVLHAFKHFTLGGFGIRQALDILLYGRDYEESIRWAFIAEKLKEFQALAFLADIIHIGNRYLGFRLEEPCPPNCPEYLLEDLVNSGIFGGETQAQRTSFQMVTAAMAVRGTDKTGGELRIVWRTIFPHKSQIMGQFPELVEKPWLLPVCWLRRMGRFIRHSRAEKGVLALKSMEIGKRRIELLKKYDVL